MDDIASKKPQGPSDVNSLRDSQLQDDAVYGDLRLREALTFMKDGIAVYGPSGHLEYCNDSFRHIHGYSEADTEIGAATYDTLGQLDSDNQVIDHKPLSFSERLAQLRSDGANSVLQYHGNRVYERRQFATASGGMINLITDITKHHHLEVAQQSRNTVLELLAKGGSLQEVLTLLIQHCESLFPDMLGSVLLMDETGTRLLAGAAPSLPSDYCEAIHGVEIGDNVGSCGTAAYRKELVIVEEIATHPYWSEICDLALDAGLEACWSHPIMATDGHVLGTFAMYYRKPRSPTAAELMFIRENASLAGIAIEFCQREMALRAALDTAEQANRAKSKFLAMMSHELRTPLNAILGFSDMLRGAHLGDIDTETYRNYASDIHRSGRHLLQLIDDLLDISAIEAGKRSLNKQHVDIIDLIEDCSRIFVPQATENGVSLTYEIADGLSSVFADERSLRQVILNLVSNSINYTEPGGNVVVLVAVEGAETIIAVKDTGVGIPQETLLHITEPFTQGHANPMLAQKGSGLGLSIVKHLVELQDGRLSIQSEVGIGTTAVIRLPVGDNSNESNQSE
jgi:two-component system cell cycle sensor histidine kinase PleC